MSDVNRLNRMITNLYTAVFERGQSTRKNRPIRLLSTIKDQLGLTENTPTLTTNVPVARYYEDMTIVGSFAGEFGSATSDDYLTYTNAIFDDPDVQFVVILNFRPQFAHGASINGWPILFEIGNDASNRIVIYYDRSADEWVIARYQGGSTANAAVTADHADDDDVLIVAYVKSGEVGISLNGGAFDTAANSYDPGISAGSFSIGNSPYGSQTGGEMIVNWMLIGNGLVDSDAATAYAALAATDPEWVDLPEDSFEAIDPCFLWAGDDETHTPTAIYGENVYAA